DITLLSEPVVDQAREGAGCFGNILLSVVAFAEGQEFHDLASVILVGMLFAALGLVEPDQHGGVFCDRDEHLLPASGSQAAEGVILQPHQIGILYLLGAGSEVAVPEES